MPGAYVVATSSIRRLKECILHLDTRFFNLKLSPVRSRRGEAIIGVWRGVDTGSNFKN